MKSANAMFIVGCLYVIDAFPKVEFIAFDVTCGIIQCVFKIFLFSGAPEARA